jgi:GNAT superfamily N-acetyltransferase
MAHESASADGYTISDDLARFDLDRAHGWIARESYWGQDIPRELFVKSLTNSLAVGVYGPSGEMAAMARVVTDRATFGWITDVFVDSGHRGAGLGKKLMTYLRDHPDLRGLRRLHLATRDAHGLYAQFGFGPLTKVDRWMEVRDLTPYADRS